MFPFMPMMPMSLPGIQPTAEQAAQMQRLALRNQHQQLTMHKEMVAQYIRSIDAALDQIQEALEKGESAEGEPSAETAAQPMGQAFAQAQALTQSQAQVQAQSRAFIQRTDPRRMDFRQDWQAQDYQAWYQGGMGDFGRAIF